MLPSWHVSWNPDIKNGDFDFFSSRDTFTTKSITDMKAAGKKNDRRQRERKKRGENESWIAHAPILCTPFTAKQYLRLCSQPWQGDGQ